MAMMPDGFVRAGLWWRWWLPRLGLYAIVMPIPIVGGRVYVLPGYEDHGELIVHERVHLDQIERYGALTFAVLYICWLLRYGYRGNPFEIEAYGISDRWAGK